MESDGDLPPPSPLTRSNFTVLVSQNERGTPALIPIQSYALNDSESAGGHVEDDSIPDLMAASDSSDEIDDMFAYNNSYDEEHDYEWDDEDDSGWEDEYDSDEEDLPRLEPLSQEQETRSEPVERPEGTTPSTPHLPLTTFSTWFAPRNPGGFGGLIPADMLETLLSLRVDPESNGEEDAWPGQQADLDRAKVLVNGLERLSNGLLKRMIRVGGAPGAYEGGGNDGVNITGCAICWNPFLNEEDVKEDPSEATHVPFAIDSNEKAEIVFLPCAHVFHSNCLLPWFSRNTSCPTCRFNLDPESSTQRVTHLSGLFNRRPADTAAQVVNANSNETPTLRDLSHEVTRVLANFEITEPESVYVSDVPGEILPTEWHLDEPGDEASGHDQHWRQPFQSSQCWTLPTAPGLSLRERIEAREQDMGMRCTSATCIYAPTDEDPQSTQVRFQTCISTDEKDSCRHSFHPACLVLETHLAGHGASVISVPGFEHPVVEIHCPSCYSLGTLSSQIWEEGMRVLPADGTSQ